MKTNRNSRNLYFRYYVETRAKASAVEAGKKRLKGAAVLASSRTAARGSLQPNDS